MPVRRIVTSSCNSRRLERAARHFLELRNGSGWLVAAETRGAADDFVRRAAPPGTGLAGVQRMSLRQAAAALAAGPMRARGLAPLSHLGLLAVCSRSISACRQAGVLEYFGPVADTPGFARALAATAGELREHGLDREALAATGAPGRDLARLLERYEKELEERRLADPARIYALAAEAAAGGQHRWTGFSVVLLDPAVESRASRRLVEALAARAPAAIATVPEGDEEAREALEGILGVKAENAANGEAPDRTLGRIQRHLFASDIPEAEPIDGSFEFFSAPGEGLEAVEIARRIGRLAAEGTPFDQIAVLLRRPDDYVALLEEALARARIPAYFSRRAARPEPAGRAFLALLACAAEGLSAARFAEYLSLGQVPREPGGEQWTPPGDEMLGEFKAPPDPGDRAPEPPPGPDDPVVAGTLQAPFQWEKLLVEAAVVGGRDRWVRRLAGLEQEYRVRLAQLEQEGDPRRDYFERQLQRLAHLQAYALPLIDDLAFWPARALWRDWLDRLETLARRALRQPEPVLAVLTELRPMEDVGPVGLDEVRSALAGYLGELRPEPEEHRFGKVFVGPVEGARGRAFEVVFLPGLAEGQFPQQTFEDPLLLDPARRQLGEGLATEDRRVARERLLLRLAAGAARSRLIASYPRIDVKIGRPRVPSFYALELGRAAEGRLPDPLQVEKRAALETHSQLGWPAPARAADAIDDAEYDLVFLSRVLREGRAPVRGAGRYLLEANPHLARSLRSRWRRWNHRGWTEADGLIGGEAVRRILERHGVRQRPYSPTALQQFAVCPYRFALYAIQQLRPRETSAALEQIDARTRGALYHEAQYEWFREARSAALLPVREATLEAALDLADRAVDRVAARYAEKLAPAIEAVWRSGVEEIRTDLRGWIVELRAVHAEWEPAEFELAFGLEEANAEVAVLDGFRLRGRIDLIERHRSRNVLRVTDHKTGKPPDRPPVAIAGGEVLQPVLYGLAAEQLRAAPVEAGLLFYATQRGRYQPVEIRLDEWARKRAAEAMRIIDQAVAQAFLAAAPRDGACQECDYRTVCGPYEERRWKRKDREPVEPLHQLRSQP